jgi:type II secretory pathway component PulF
MPDFLRELMVGQADLLRRILAASLGVLVWLGAAFLAVGVVAAVYSLIAEALRRRERARCFLDLIESGIAQGQSPERVVVSLSVARVHTLGAWFHLVAAHIESGLRLGAALDRVPWFLPAPVCAMLKVGESIGDLRKVLPACRAVFQRQPSTAQVSQNNLVAVLTMLPVGVAVNWSFMVVVVPKFKELTMDMVGSAQQPSWALFELSFALAWVLAGLWLLLYTLECLPGMVPRFRAWMARRLWPLLHWIDFALPWRRRRMHRDFSAMLSTLLDAGVPEARALQLAAEATANNYFLARAGGAMRDLEAGRPLAEAMRRLDDAGEFHWRLRNAAQAGGSFVAALRGWHDALEARAFQQEQAASNCLTVGFVLLNGVMVSLMAAGVFLVLIAIMAEAPLW